MILPTHKDNQAAEHYGHSPGKVPLLHAETLLGFYSGRLHTESVSKYIRATLSLYKGGSSLFGSHSGSRFRKRPYVEGALETSTPLPPIRRRECRTPGPSFEKREKKIQKKSETFCLSR
jgi:hypothetical protein